MFNIIGIDWGSHRFGLAFGSSETELVIPCECDCLSDNIFEVLREEMGTRKIEKIVIGIPSNFKGGNTEVSDKINHFIRNLRSEFPNIKIKTFNERGSTKQAKDWLGSKKNKTDINHLAAVKILQDYFKYNSN